MVERGGGGRRNGGGFKKRGRNTRSHFHSNHRRHAHAGALAKTKTQKMKLELPFKLQKELGLTSSEEVHKRKNVRRENREGSGKRRRDEKFPTSSRDVGKSGKNNTRRSDDGVLAERDRRFREDNEKDDRLGRSLAKKLKMKNADAKFGLDDGLNEVLEGLPTFEEEEETSASELSGGEDISSSSSSSSSSSEEDVDEVEATGGRRRQSSGGESSSSSDSSESISGGERERVAAGAAKAAETPAAPVGRYVPPALRNRVTIDNSIARKVRGLLNRITEATVQNIAYEISAIVDSYQIQKKVIQDLICGELIRAAVEGPRASPQFAAVTSMCVFGLAAQLGSSEIVAKFTALIAEKVQSSLRGEDGRALHNLVLTFVHMASIGSISYSTVFSFLFHLKDEFSVQAVECIYTVLRYVGSFLRSSDPLKMKEFVIAVHEKAGSIRSSNDGSLTQKQEILLKSVVDIKNNRQRGNFGRNCHPLNPNISTWFKKSNAAELCLQNLSWQSLLSSDKKGLWWLSGSDLRTAGVANELDKVLSDKKRLGQLGPDYLKLASEQRMNTDIRRSIFVVVMSSEDYVDAFERLMGLGLKGSQEREISRVLVHCCIQETAYNPYYFFIAKSFIKQSKQQKLSFIFTISDKLKELDRMNVRSIANISNLVSALAAAKLVPFTIIKALNLAGNINKKEALFLQIMLEQYFKVCREETIQEQLLGLYMKPEYKTIQTSLSMYIIKYFPKYLKHSKIDKNVVKEIKVKSAIALKALNGSAL